MNRNSCGCSEHNHLLCAGRVPIFSTLSQEELRHVVSLIVQKRYSKDSFIYNEGSLNQNLIIVNKGKVKTFCHTPDGKEQIFYILTEGDFVGARNLISGTETTFSAQTMEDTVVCMINKVDFQALLLKYPAISLKIMEVLCMRLEKMESLVKKISPKDADARINMMLLEFSREYGCKHDEGILVELPLNREEMAQYIGVSRETVSRKLTALKEEGIIQLIGNKKILILNERALESSI